MAGCAATCLHYQLVSDYRQERQRQETEADEDARGHAEELAARLPHLINFRKWLEGSRR